MPDEKGRSLSPIIGPMREGESRYTDLPIVVRCVRCRTPLDGTEECAVAVDGRVHDPVCYACASAMTAPAPPYEPSCPDDCPHPHTEPPSLDDLLRGTEFEGMVGRRSPLTAHKPERDEFDRCTGCLYSAGHALDCPTDRPSAPTAPTDPGGAA